MATALQTRCKTLHLIGHFNELGSVGHHKNAGQKTTANYLMNCLVAADVHELVLYGCWGGK